MKIMIAAAALLVPGMAFAQSLSNPQPSMNMPNYSTERSSMEGRDPLPPKETAAVRAEKLARAVALREEALVLEAQDGGRLSRKSTLYLQRKARLILAYR
ncbi:hypothetical protein [Polymorphobacter fuscus]|uniref:DUF4148 domain-containing protein n=1 Tax=Sandarakinorhabdus fusca TaxID=1439888 RepID=A0A7C9GXK5_9SPHN|nr:hypothetical protein [Polymorphobacter fuscus]KAB7646153.1 hypothetical protein F9290_08770 [Polymorphobacter fuscus]MQT17354.1 hypothetical protein [Polymorphobacter fuscus]NJC10112.1 hypothetical protein [Polymorphobacter fuscus]